MKIQSGSESLSGKTSLKANQQQTQDSQLKAIQGQIDNVQKQIKELNGDKEVTAEEKMSKRKELQTELQNLNTQMAQRKIEIQKEKREAAAEAQQQEANKNDVSKESQKGVEAASKIMSSKTFEGIVSADNSIKQVNLNQKVKTKLEGTNRVLESEIAIDKTRGVDTSNKQEEVDQNKKNIEKIMEDIGEKVADASKSIENGNEIDKLESKAQKEKEAEKDKDEKLTKGSMKGKSVQNLDKGQYIDEYL